MDSVLSSDRSVDALLDRAFGDHAKIVVPWRGASRRRKEPLYDREVVGSFVASQPRLVEVDPIELRATQTWVVRSHVRYYLSGEWERTGRTSADMHVRGNRYPLIWTDARGDRVILAGHHRSMAARLTGTPLLARLVGSEPDVGVAVTPSIWWDAPAKRDDMADLRQRLAAVGLDELEQEERLRFARLVEP
jgi:hypothetical protein